MSYELRTLIREITTDFRSCWKRLFLADIVYKVISFVVLTPLVAGMFHVLMAFAGNSVLADQDILFFFMKPAGWICLIVVGALSLGVVALEMVTLLAILATVGQTQIGFVDALLFAKTHAKRVLGVTGRMVAYTLLIVAPFLAVAGIAYMSLLTEFDINYYMKEKPPVFLVALGIGAVIVVTLSCVLLRLFTGWFFALPLVVFEDVSPYQALRVSRERANGNRRTLLIWILGWLLASVVVSAVVTSVVVGVGRFVVPLATGSLSLLTIVLGVSLLVWFVASLAVNLLSTTIFAAMHFKLYCRMGSDGGFDASQIGLGESKGVAFGFEFTPRRLLIGGVVAMVAATVIGGVAVHGVRLDDNVAIVAHRGASKAAPENTLAAFEQAIDDKSDWVELDVQETADGQVVVFHDSDFMKLAGKNLKIWDATQADLEKIDIGSWFDPNFKDQRVPSLKDALLLCKGKAGVAIELKYYGHDEQLEQRVVDVVRENEMTQEVMFLSLKLDAVKKMKRLEPSCKAGLLLSVSTGGLKNIDADILAVNAAFANRAFIQAAHKAGKEVYVWTVNDSITMSRMIGRGVDGLITDKPALARSVLKQRAELSAPERLLAEFADAFGIPAEIGEQ